MIRGSALRRLRVRRERKGETLLKALEAPVDVETRRSAGSSPSTGHSRAFDPMPSTEGVEIVANLGCCVVEAIGSAAALLALLTVPAYLLIR